MSAIVQYLDTTIEGEGLYCVVVGKAGNTVQGAS